MSNAESKILGMSARSKVQMLIRTARAISMNMLHSELSLGLTFLNIALTTNDSDRAYRNLANARKAYERVLYFGKRMSFTKAESCELQNNLVRLKQGLQQLREYM